MVVGGIVEVDNGGDLLRVVEENVAPLEVAMGPLRLRAGTLWMPESRSSLASRMPAAISSMGSSLREREMARSERN